MFNTDVFMPEGGTGTCLFGLLLQGHELCVLLASEMLTCIANILHIIKQRSPNTSYIKKSLKNDTRVSYMYILRANPVMALLCTFSLLILRIIRNSCKTKSVALTLIVRLSY